MWIQNCFKSLISTSTRRRPIRRHPAAGRLQVESLEGRCLPSFSMSVDYGVGLAAQSLVSADFNGDGRLDLATAIRDDHTVSVLLGNGDGTFQAPRTSGTGSYPESLVVADLNGDNSADLVTRGISPNNISVLLAKGDGTFQPPQAITLPAQSPPGYTGPPMEQGFVSVAIGDFNGDGKLDLVAGAQTVRFPTPDDLDFHVDNYANVLLGIGDGTFRPATVKHLAGGYPLLHPGDFNNDGRLDIVLNGGSALGNGDGTLQDFVPFNISVEGVSKPLGDFNGDGKLDVLSDNQTGPILWVGNGNGTFQQPRYLDLTGEWHTTVAGDVNADGKLDIVVMTNSVAYSYDAASDSYYDPVTTRTARVLLGNGDGSFAEPIIVGLGTVAGKIGFTTPVLADFDGNGFPDLAATETEYYLTVDGYEAAVYRGVHVALNDGIWTLPPPPPPSITMSDVTVTEGNTGTRVATFTVTLSAAYGQPVTVAYATANGTVPYYVALAGSDYQAASGTLTIPAGQTSGTISVLINGDRLGEPNETFVVNLSSPTNATIADGQGVGTIVDDEPRISIGDVTKSEGKRGQTTLFTFTVTLSAAYDQAVTMSFRTVNGTATSGDGDYIAKTGTLTFAPGETSKTITIEVKGDSKREANETFYLDLYGLSINGLFTKNRGVGTILNDD